VIAWWAGIAMATITLDAEPAREGVEAIVLVTDEIGDPQSGETVRVVHRPGLAGEKELAIGITDGRGRVRWTPETAGIAKIRAGEQVQPIRVVADRPPTTSGVAIALLFCAGLLALGFGLRGPRRAGRRE
jgi:hypothetical protein